MDELLDFEGLAELKLSAAGTRTELEVRPFEKLKLTFALLPSPSLPSSPSVLIAYTPAGSEPHKAFNVFANSHRDSYLFGSTADPKAFSLAGLSPSEPSIVLYKSFDEGKNVLPTEIFSALTAESLGSWIKVNAIPLLAEISPENFASYSEAGIPLAYTFVDPEQKAANDKLIKTLEPIAAEYKGKLSFVWIDAVKFIDHAKSLNLDVESWPGFVIQDLAADRKSVV